MTYKDWNIGKSDCACSVKAIQTYPNLAERAALFPWGGMLKVSGEAAPALAFFMSSKPRSWFPLGYHADWILIQLVMLSCCKSTTPKWEGRSWPIPRCVLISAVSQFSILCARWEGNIDFLMRQNWTKTEACFGATATPIFHFFHWTLGLEMWCAVHDYWRVIGREPLCFCCCVVIFFRGSKK